jgi:hypothetical protein
MQCDDCHRWIETVSMDPHDCPGESVAFKAGRNARAQRIPLRQSALRVMRPESKQYDDFVDGYDFENEQRKRKPSAKASESHQ